MDYLLFETDSPHVPLGDADKGHPGLGKFFYFLFNYSFLVVNVAKEVAEIKKRNLEDVVAAVYKNSKDTYNL